MSALSRSAPVCSVSVLINIWSNLQINIHVHLLIVLREETQFFKNEQVLLVIVRDVSRNLGRGREKRQPAEKRS